MIHNQYVDEYIDDYKSGKILLNDERKKLIKLLEEDVLQRDVYFDERRITNCIKFIEKWYFPLQPFQKFIIAFMFLRCKGSDELFYSDYLILMGRGAGNCYSELLMGFLRNPKYRISPVLKFVEKHMVPLKKAGVVWGCDVQYMITGNANQHPRTAIAFTADGRTDYDNFYTQITSYE